MTLPSPRDSPLLSSPKIESRRQRGVGQTLLPSRRATGDGSWPTTLQVRSVVRLPLAIDTAIAGIAFFVLLVVAAGCAAPLHVWHVDPRQSYRGENSNVLSGTDVSDFTRTVLRRYDLLDRYLDESLESERILREAVRENRNDNDALFALAELSYLYAVGSDRQTHGLAAAVYAWAFLFPENEQLRPTALDPRTRIACDLYNRAVADAFRDESGSYIVPQDGTFRLPFGTMNVQFDADSLQWHDYRLSDLESLGDLEIQGLRNRYRTAGIGAPLSAHPLPPTKIYSDDELVGPNVRVPVTLILRVDEPRRQLGSNSLHATLALRATTDDEAIRIGTQDVPLEAEPTAVVASTLSSSRPWELELASFLGNALKLKSGPTLLRAMQPYRRGKIPVVFVHGTASSVFRWADMINDLQSDRRIRDHYQFWFFTYDSGNPILYSAYRLRRLLTDQLRRFDPDGTDPALRRMVVIGHSQGGLLTKLTAIHSQDRFWHNVSDAPFEEAELSPSIRELLQSALFLEPLPFVTRVVFIATPHRGSYLAGPQIVRRLVQRLVSLPSDLLGIGTELSGLRANGKRYMSLEYLPTSIDNMSPGHPFIRTLSEIPIDPAVHAHSIIPVVQETDIADGDDGVVQYRSAYLEGADSTLVVHDHHSTQANPHTIEEVRRILLLHIDESDDEK